ncbi:MAG TPA: DUF2950 domain-containing protein [Candidatus Sulfotelmatobacter sp.]|nr:DUF2950 domain-containing protein [Candidatus Sulfotelmatobacter sp.]
MTYMTSKKMNAQHRFISFLVAVVFLWLLGCGRKPAEQTFSTPDDAVVALVDAVKANDSAKIDAILGPDARTAIASGDDVADRNGRDVFVAAYFQQASLSGDDTTKTLYIGTEKWPFPIPVVKAKGGWHFDTAAGIDELRFRRIGRNELATIDVCLSYYDAQKEYAEKSHDGIPAGTYAQRFASTPGKQDGLYWQVKEGEEPSPLGELAAEAAAEGYSRSASEPTPFHGYYFRILTAQGANEPGGAGSYIENGLMRKGFALVAFPAEYDKGGVMTFVVNQDGVVYQKDLGADTAKVAAEIKQFDPGSGWEKANAESYSNQ